MQWYIKCIKNYAEFSGRAGRKEYWFFTLMNLVIIGLLSLLTGTKEIAALYAAFVLVPALAVSWRRLHDSDKSGLFYFFNLIPFFGNIIFIVFMCLKGTIGDNRFGEDPLTIDETVR